MTFLLAACMGVLVAADTTTEVRTALEAYNELVGDWNGSGAPDKPRPDPKDAWQETAHWSWRFKGDDVWLVFKVEKGKYFKEGELRYLPDKKRYQFSAVEKNGAKIVFEGEGKNGYLTLDHIDPATRETHRLTMNTAAEGLRFIYKLSRKPAGRTLFTKDYLVAFTKQGESFAAGDKKPECVVTGALGTSTVQYKGVTYYVCCSGCRDAFNENPEKFIKEFEARKKKK